LGLAASTQLLHGGPGPYSAPPTGPSAAPRALDQHEARFLGGPLLVPPDGVDDPVDRIDVSSDDRQGVGGEQPLYLVAQIVRAGEPQGREQAEADRLAMAVAP
jgi:hypothetical protein